MSHTCIVVPCYNEADRLDTRRFLEFSANGLDIRFLFVNDGSTDNTLDVLKRACDAAPRLEVHDLGENRGKAEAVRRGFMAAFESNPRYVGFWDADLATPLHDITQFCELLDTRPELDMVFGSRVMLLGRQIKRSPSRHYAGRVFATAVSLMLRLPVYDTQCGAKLFRMNDGIRSLFAEPFLARWVFDVEIIARDIQRRNRAPDLPGVQTVIYENPLHNWVDVAGSKLKATDFFWSMLDVFKIYWHYLRKSRLRGS